MWTTDLGGKGQGSRVVQTIVSDCFLLISGGRGQRRGEAALNILTTSIPMDGGWLIGVIPDCCKKKKQQQQHLSPFT